MTICPLVSQPMMKRYILYRQTTNVMASLHVTQAQRGTSVTDKKYRNRENECL